MSDARTEYYRFLKGAATLVERDGLIHWTDGQLVGTVTAAPTLNGVDYTRGDNWYPEIGAAVLLRGFDDSDRTVIVSPVEGPRQNSWLDPTCLALFEVPDLTDLAAVESWLAR